MSSWVQSLLGFSQAEGEMHPKEPKYGDDASKQIPPDASDASLTPNGRPALGHQEIGKAVTPTAVKENPAIHSDLSVENIAITGSYSNEKYTTRSHHASPSFDAMENLHLQVSPNGSLDPPRLFSVDSTHHRSTVLTGQTSDVPNDAEGMMDPEIVDSTAVEVQILPSSSPSPFIKPPPGPGPGPGPRPGPGPGPGPAVRPQIIAPAERNTAASQNRSQQSREKDWAKIKRLRVDIWGLRSNICAMRGAIEKKKLAMSKADDAFVQYVREQTLGTDTMKALNEHSILQALLRDCEVARNEHGPLEYEYDLVESDLSNQEYILQKLETKFYERSLDPPASQPRDPDTAPQPVESSSYTESEASQHYHPLVREYLSKLGDVDIIQERLDWHLDEKEGLLEEKEKRNRVGLELAAADQQWLDNFDVAKSELVAQLEQAETEAGKLRQECFSRGLIDEEDNPTDFEHRERQTFLSDVGSVEEASEYVNFPILIPPPDGKQVDLSELGPEDSVNTKNGIVNPRLRVDKWLLHQLQMSVLDVNLLAQTFKSEYGDIQDGGRWQDEVLEKWFEDSGKELHQGPRTVSSIFTQGHLENDQGPQGFGSGLFTQSRLEIDSLSDSASAEDDSPSWKVTFR